jgi:hypothetical protein
MSYPVSFLRGISDSNHITPNGDVSGAAFYFDDKHHNDEWCEQSINWEDDDGALEILLNQKKDDNTPQFKVGAFRGPLEGLDYIKSLTKGVFSYERKQLPNNVYHGNILLKRNTHKHIMKNIAGMLATHCNCMGKFIPRTSQ